MTESLAKRKHVRWEINNTMREHVSHRLVDWKIRNTKPFFPRKTISDIFSIVFWDAASSFGLWRACAFTHVVSEMLTPRVSPAIKYSHKWLICSLKRKCSLKRGPPICGRQKGSSGRATVRFGSMCSKIVAAPCFSLSPSLGDESDAEHINRQRKGVWDYSHSQCNKLNLACCCCFPCPPPANLHFLSVLLFTLFPPPSPVQPKKLAKASLASCVFGYQGIPWVTATQNSQKRTEPIITALPN